MTASAERLTRRDGPSLELLVARPVRASSAAPVLFLHGAFSGAWCWDESWLGAFASSGRFSAAVSLRGHGRSGGGGKALRAGLGDFADDLELAIDAMPEPPVVVAHSLGGLVAQRLLGRVPMRGLILSGSLPPEGLALVGPWLCWSTGGTAAIGALARRPFAGPPGRAEAMFGKGVGTAAAARYGARMGRGALVALAEAHLPRCVAPAFLVGVPTLALHGAEDRLVGPSTAMRSALYHGGALRLVVDAGHFLMLGPRARVGSETALSWLADQGL